MSWQTWRTSERHSWAYRITAVVVLVIAAYHYTLSTLLSTLQYETPLAYLGLVPVMALATALLLAPQRQGEPSIHDRQVDYIVGLPLIGIALAITTLLPARLSAAFWLWRVDLLSMPIFVAGVISVVCGVRAVWRVRLALGLLLLAWPLPYTYLLTHWLDGFTSSTIGAVRAITRVIGGAHGLPGPNGLFQVVHDRQPFTVSIASACSGVDGIVGFLIVAGPLSALVAGTWWRKLIWLALGITLVWALNVARIVLLLTAGTWWGQGVALKGLHPIIGLLLFGTGLVGLVLLMPVLHLRLDVLTRGPRQAAETAPRPRLSWRRRMTAVLGLTAVLVPSALLSVANASMVQYSLVASDLGAPRIAAFTTTPAVVPGFAGRSIANYPWAERYFGSDSDWTRYVYLPTGSAAANPPITLDVVRADKLSALTAYGVEECYDFHHFNVRGTTSLDLGGGITGNSVSYVRDGVQWESQYWIWPVLDGGRTRYERIVLLLPTDSGTRALAAPAPNTDPLRGLGLELFASSHRKGGDVPSASRSTQAYLTSFARVLIAHRAAESQGSRS